MPPRSPADTLNQEDIPTARGPQWSRIYSGEWTDTTIRSLLVNQVYTGDMIWNRRTDARFHKIQEGCAVERERVHASRLVPNDESDWIIVRDAHPALISRRIFDQAKLKRENQPSSIEQRGRNSRLRSHGKTWSGRRSRFILSGLLTCARCGSRYQGITQGRGSKLQDGARVVTSYYACGGYITKGKKVCEMNPIPQQDLEMLVIDAVLGFYKPCLEKGGREKIVTIVRKQLGCENEELVAARQRAEEERQRVGGIINNLLDNITADNREMVDGRLKQLNDQRKQLELRLAELDRLAASQAEINSIVTDALQLISGLKFTLNQGLPQEKLCALRQCVERILIDKPGRSVIVKIKAVPASTIQEVEELACELGPADAVAAQ
ncbi:MAG: recombinase family protein [Planctomycetota bacterium]|nr:recombinase family protein [Planctomycetota bacterium]